MWLADILKLYQSDSNQVLKPDAQLHNHLSVYSDTGDKCYEHKRTTGISMQALLIEDFSK